MKRNLLSLFTLAVLIISSQLFSQNKTGTAGMTYLKMNVTARPAAMAGTFIGLSDDASSLNYNPAGMINVQNMEYISSYRSYYDGIQDGYFGMVLPLKEFNGAAGVQVSYLNTGDIDETTPQNPMGTGRTFSASDLVVGVSYAQMLTTKFYVGGTVKYIREQLADVSANTMAADVGTYFDTKWKSLIFGMSIRNFGGNFTYIKEDTPLPMLFVFGIKFVPWENDGSKLNTLIEAGHPSDNGEYVSLGLEYSLNDMFFVRAGRTINGKENWFTTSEMNKDVDHPLSADGTKLKELDSEINLNGTTAGLGFKLADYGISADYAYTYHRDLGNTHMFTLGYSLR